MLILKLWSNFTGYVIIRVKGKSLEKFINMAAGRGTRIWDIRRATTDMLYASTTVAGFKALRPLARRLNCQVRIRRRCGLPFVLQTLSRRKVLAAGLFLFLALLWGLSSFVWFVRLEGASRVPEAQLRARLADMGLHVGVPVAAVDPASLEKALLREFGGLAWVGVRVQGTMVRVEVVEKVPVEAERVQPCNVVSRRDGVVTSVVALMGEPLVREGDTVLEGQTLISGVVPLYRERVESAVDASGRAKEEKVIEPVEQAGLLGTSGPYGYVHADGIVRARVWYEGESRVPFSGTEWLPTSRVRRALVIEVAGRRTWLGPRTTPFARCRVSQQRLWVHRNVALPVEIIKVSYHELAKTTFHVGVDVAREKAITAAGHTADAAVGSKSKVLRREVSVSSDRHSVTARVVVECEEEVQAGKSISVGAPPPATNAR